jgi:hypothetical protein
MVEDQKHGLERDLLQEASADRIWEGSRPRDPWFVKVIAGQVEGLVMITMQTRSRRARTRALPIQHNW